MKQMPDKAEQEIQDCLARDFRISSSKMEEILERNGVRGDGSVLQTRYRKSLAQRYMASLRDEDGKREILAVPNRDTGEMEYVVLDACNDIATLNRIGRRLENQSAGLAASAVKVHRRTGFLAKFMKRRQK